MRKRIPREDSKKDRREGGPARGDRERRDGGARGSAARKPYGGEDKSRGEARRYEPREVPRGEDGRPIRGKSAEDREAPRRPMNSEEGGASPFGRRKEDSDGAGRGVYSRRDEARPERRREERDASGGRSDRREDRAASRKEATRETTEAHASSGEIPEGKLDIAAAAAAYRAAKKAGKKAKTGVEQKEESGSKVARDRSDRPARPPRREADAPVVQREDKRPARDDRGDRRGDAFQKRVERPTDWTSGQWEKPRPAHADGAPRGPRKDGPGYVRKPLEKREPKPAATPKVQPLPTGGPMTLNKYLAHSGVSSRRAAAVMIKEGKVSVNGAILTEPGYRVQDNDVVTMEGKAMQPQKHFVYVLLNKPKGYLTTTSDDRERKTVMELVQDACEGRLYPVGRLDQNTTGVLLLTNDGAFADRLSHPKYEVKKVYQATLDRDMTPADLDKLVSGVELEDGVANANEAAILESKNEVGLEMHSGRNRVVRRMFEALGYKVVKLDRVSFAGLTKKNVSRGQWRHLTEHELVLLKHFKA